MTIWEQLGINVTKDIAVIRSAYAAKAKELHPEEHPGEFQELQKAYKAAVKYAKSGGKAVQFIKEEDLAVRIEIIRPEQKKTEMQKEAEAEPEQQKKADMEVEVRRETEAEILETDEGKEHMFDYDYREIQEETASYQFFQEFFYIVWNPWLLNNRICWDLFLHRPQYKVLYEDRDFRDNLVKTMCGLSGWHRGTIRYFDSFLKTFQTENERKAETEYFWWRFKRSRPWNKGIVTTEKWITKEQKDMQSILLSTVRKKMGFYPKGKKQEESFFADRRAVETYLQIYLDYAPKNPRKLEKMYHANCSGKSFARSMFLVLLFWICLIGFINLTGDFPKRQTEQEKRQEEWEQERKDNIKKYLEKLDYNESAKSKMVQCEVAVPKLEAGQHPGAAILLDYEGNDKIIFHGAFGLFVYDTKEEKMLKMLDLEYIGCDAVQGADCCQVRVTEDGSEIYLSRIEDNEYTEMYIYKWEEDSLYKTSHKEDISGKTFYDCEKNEGVLIEGNSIGEICYKVGDMEIRPFETIS